MAKKAVGTRAKKSTAMRPKKQRRRKRVAPRLHEDALIHQDIYSA